MPEPNAPNQAMIGANAAALLRPCPNCGGTLKMYAGGGVDCPECVADHLVYEDVSPFEGRYCDGIGE